MSDSFEDGLRRYKETVERATREGAALAGMELLRRANTLLPKVPHEHGDLAASGSVFVDNALVKTAVEMGFQGPNPTPATELTIAQAVADRLIVTVGYNTPYAAYQHEGMRKDESYKVERYTDPDSGAKFIETRLAEDSGKMVEIIAKTVKKALGGDGYRGIGGVTVA